MKKKKYDNRKNHTCAQHKGNNRSGGGIYPTVTINIKNLHIHMDERMNSTSLILPDEPEDCGKCGMCGNESGEE